MYACYDLGLELTTLFAQVSFPVPANGDEWIVAELLRDQFTTSHNAQDTIDTTAQLENELQASIELYALFLRFVAEKLDAEPQSEDARAALLLDALKHFTALYLSEHDIHKVSADFDIDARKNVLSAYYYALATLEEKDVDVPRAPVSALFSAAESGDASVYALFGGQGTNEVYFDELQTLYDTYALYVTPFVAAMTTSVLLPLAATHDSTNFYAYGLNILAWLTGTLPRPPVAYLASVPISYVGIALTQLTQYLIICRVANLTPGELRGRFAGATGHSQGLGSALAISASTTPESFFENAAKMLRWSFFSALRAQEAFPVLALEPSIVKDAIDGGEGAPTPMLLVAGLLIKDLEVHIKKTNTHLPKNSQLQVSLNNAQKAFIVTGPPRALYGLVTSLRKVRAASGLDQSKIPFSQRKPVFNVRFLVVNAPFHSPYLEGVTQKVCEDLGEELWTSEDLGIPVYNTEDGEFSYSRAFQMLTSTQDQTCEPSRHL